MIRLENMMSDLAQRSRVNIYCDLPFRNCGSYDIILEGRTTGRFLVWQNDYLILTGDICTLLSNFDRQIFLQNILILQCSLLQKTKTLVALDSSGRRMILYAVLPIVSLSISSLENMFWDFLHMREMWCDYARQSKQII